MASNPERWDYSAAGVPSALTEDMAAHQEARDAEKKARHRAKEKVRPDPPATVHRIHRPLTSDATIMPLQDCLTVPISV